MTTADLRAWQSEHADDYRRMAGLVTAIGLAFATLGALAIWIAIQ